MALACAVLPAPAPTVGVSAAGRRPAARPRGFGATVTDGEPAARGVGAVVGSNPLPVVVPCHRVLAADGPGGFGGGSAGVLTPTLDLWPG